VKALNNTAIDANVTMNIIDAGFNGVSWGPDSTEFCGDIAPNTTCVMMWDNSGPGYIIPNSATTGVYSFAWNVTMSTDNGDIQINNTELFMAECWWCLDT